MTTHRPERPKLGRRKQQTTAASQRISAADLRKQLDQRTRELAHARKLLTEALQQQTATADVLKVISRSAIDLQTVLDPLLGSACRLCEADIGTIRYREGSEYRLAATFGFKPEWIDHFSHYSTKPDRGSIFGRTIVDGRTTHIPDVLADPGWRRQSAQKLMGFRAALGVPLVRDGQTFGVISLLRFAAGSFSEKQIELVESFAAQAVIAIENARLFEEVQTKTRDLEESLQQQTATSEVLQIISSSPGDLTPVFDKMLENATQVCGAKFGSMVLVEADILRQVALYNAPPELAAVRTNQVRQIHPSSSIATSVRDKRAVEVEDIRRSPAYLARAQHSVELAELGGARTMVVVPMLRDNQAIGVITVYRQEVRPFSAKQIDLLTNFARQAVIAIENARLLKELRQRTDDLTEALTYQTGSANILKVIASSPTDVEPVLTEIVKSACVICEAEEAHVALTDGDELVFQVLHGSAPVVWKRRLINRLWVAGRAAVDHRPVHVHDLLSPEGDEFPDGRELARRDGARTVLAVPLLREGGCIGVIALRRMEVRPFSEKQIELLQTFADQAVIAIGNVHLFDKVQARTRELAESLEQQTATSGVLEVISSSPGELEPVFQALLENATRLCQASYGVMWLREGDSFRCPAIYGPLPPAYIDQWRSGTLVHPTPHAPLTLVTQARRAVQIPDLRESRSYLNGEPLPVSAVEVGGIRTLLLVPMLKEDDLVGAIAIYRQEVRTFTDNQIDLVSNFAKQAVIAIENTRLLNELRQSLQQQTATADVLKIISRSSVELETVLDTLVETAARLCRADQANMVRRRDDMLHLVASCGLSEEAKAFVDTHPLALDHGSVSGRVGLERRAVHIPDVLQDPEYTYRDGQKVMGFRTALGVPLLRGDELIGIFSINRRRVEPFTDKEIELATTFADQAVIAIENARLFEELRDRQAELRVTFDNMGDGVVMFDAAGRLTAWNRNFREMLELPDGFLAGRPTYAEYFRYLAERGEYTADLEAELSRANEDPRRELRIERTRPDGRVIEARRNPVPDGGFVLIYADITERKRAEEAIRVARDAAEKALRELQMAQASLVHAQKMAALGQLTAGIAHEIKNPLNFVNNFAALSSELTDELSDVLKPVALPGKVHEEVKELTGTLKDNLGRVVQHGKRADFIVKNMLLHSREGSGEHRPVEINAIIDESLNLAYHGARAEKQGFNITLEREFDPGAGVADIYPQEITRVLLNLISNGFYAATQRAGAAGNGFEPRLRAVTRNLGDRVEVRIRDNGTGIPPDIQEKIFNPFFTTKPAGEGTGLGLSMSHDIVVKQHGGTIEVATEPGSFTEFIIRLLRAMPVQAEAEGQRS